jgi:hypothetical protein
MEIKEIVELRGLRREWQNITLRVADYLQKVNARYKIYQHDSFYTEMNGLEEDYQELISRTSTILKLFKIKEELLPKRLSLQFHYDLSHAENILYEGEAKVFLYRLAKECAKVIEIIDGLTLCVALPEEREKELEDVEKKIKEEIEPILPLFSTDLLESIKYFRSGYFLGSVLICGRIIVFFVEKVKSQIPDISKIEPSQQWDAVINFLKEKKIIKVEEGKMILEAIKLYRNKYSHIISEYPNLEESLLIIIGVTMLVDKVAKNIKEFSFLQLV